MMILLSRKSFICYSAACLLYFLNSEQGFCSSLPLTANWNYQSGSDADAQFNESYSASLSKSVALSNQVALGANMRYGRTRSKDSGREIININPNLRYSYDDDYSQLALSVEANEIINPGSDNANISDRTWRAKWNNAWVSSGLWPELSLSFSKNYSFDHAHPKTSDNVSDQLSSKVAWSRDLGSLQLTYSSSENKNIIALSSSVNENYGVQVNTSKPFWQNKALVSFSQKYSHSANTNEVTVTENTGVAHRELSISQAYAKETDELNIHDLTLSSLPALLNNDRSDAALRVNNPAQPVNIALKTDFEIIDLLYLYTDVELAMAVADDFIFDLYISPNGITWTRQNTAIAYSYNGIEKRYEFQLNGVQEEYIKLVAVADPAIEVIFTEIEAYLSYIGSVGTVFTDSTSSAQWNTMLSLSLQITPDLSLSSSGSYDKRESSQGPDNIRNNLSSTASWVVSDSVSSSLSFNQSSAQRGSGPEALSRNYSLSVGLAPIPTISSSFNTSYSENFLDGEKLSTNTSYSFSARGIIYPDLNAGLNCSYSESEDLLQGSTSTSLGSTANITARLFPDLQLNWSGGLTQSNSASASYRSGLGWSWRPSSLLSMSGSFSQSWAETSTADMSYSMTVATSSKTRVGLSFNKPLKPAGDSSYGANMSWNISSHLSLQLNGSYVDSLSAVDTWSFGARLNARYSIL